MAYKIHITEDDKITALMEKQILEQQGYEVISMTENAEDCLAEIEREKPDVVLMDINLPGETDGISAAHKIAGTYNIPVVYVTGNEDKATMMRAIRSHSFGYIIKPLKPEVIYTTIEMTMQRFRLEEELQLSRQELANLNEQLEAKVEERTAELQKNYHQLEMEIERREAIEVDLKESLAREKEVSELKSRIVTIVSHEFKTPLTTILSSIELIAFHVDNNAPLEKIDKHIKTIGRTIHELVNMINDTLFLSRADAGKVERKDQDFDPKKLIDDIVDSFRNGVGKGHDLSLNYSNDFPQLIRTDPGLVKTSLNNLVSNAIKYSPDHKDIFIDASLEKDHIKISVKDSGIGIPKKDQGTLFELFHRASNTINIDGSGIGLSTVKRCSTMLEGEVYFESEEHEGSTFFFEFPFQSPNS
jgi:signal transduction histidine kinase